MHWSWTDGIMFLQISSSKTPTAIPLIVIWYWNWHWSKMVSFAFLWIYKPSLFWHNEGTLSLSPVQNLQLALASALWKGLDWILVFHKLKVKNCSPLSIQWTLDFKKSIYSHYQLSPIVKGLIWLDSGY